MGQAAAIIVAGGQGVRFGGPVRKQYLRLARRPVLWWTLRAFERSPSIRGIVIVVPADDRRPVYRTVFRWKVRKLVAVVAGGKTRADSVRAGLQALPADYAWVAVHDGVRPLITVETIEATLSAARKHRGAIAACRSKDTVKLADRSGGIASTPPRESVWLAQTPQTFERRLLERAHAAGKRLTVTDDAQLVERLGVRVRLVEAPYENLKVTVPSDLLLAERILRQRKK
jgi:2-C-methyl-D-erythritol 4-phosphate cytidylyltransferase